MRDLLGSVQQKMLSNSHIHSRGEGGFAVAKKLGLLYDQFLVIRSHESFQPMAAAQVVDYKGPYIPGLQLRKIQGEELVVQLQENSNRCPQNCCPGAEERKQRCHAVLVWACGPLGVVVEIGAQRSLQKPGPRLVPPDS